MYSRNFSSDPQLEYVLIYFYENLKKLKTNFFVNEICKQINNFRILYLSKDIFIMNLTFRCQNHLKLIVFKPIYIIQVK